MKTTCSQCRRENVLSEEGICPFCSKRRISNNKRYGISVGEFLDKKYRTGQFPFYCSHKFISLPYRQMTENEANQASRPLRITRSERAIDIDMMGPQRLNEGLYRNNE